MFFARFKHSLKYNVFGTFGILIEFVSKTFVYSFFLKDLKIMEWSNKSVLGVADLISFKLFF